MKIPLPKRRKIPTPVEAYSEFICSACSDNLTNEALKKKKCQWCGASTEKGGNQKPNDMITRWNRCTKARGGCKLEPIKLPQQDYAPMKHEPWRWPICTKKGVPPLGDWEGKVHK